MSAAEFATDWTRAMDVIQADSFSPNSRSGGGLERLQTTTERLLSALLSHSHWMLGLSRPQAEEAQSDLPSQTSRLAPRRTAVFCSVRDPDPAAGPEPNRLSGLRRYALGV